MGTTMLPFGLCAAIIYISSLVFTQANTIVLTVANGSIDTYVEDNKLRGIPFKKRVINQTSLTSITFNVSSTHPFDQLLFEWFLNETPLVVPRYSESLPDKLGNIYSVEVISNDVLKLTLYLRKKGLVAGVYKLSVSAKGSTNQHVEATGFATVYPTLPLFPKDRRVIDGDRLSIFCEVSGYPKPSEVKWSFAPIKPDLMDDTSALVDAKQHLAPLNLTSTAYTFNSKSVLNDQLVFDGLTPNFNGLYECSVESDGMRDETLILVNVKDRWAALWPFIGIVIEVVVLVTGILLYERHQMRSKTSKADVPVCAAQEAPAPARSRPAATQQVQQNNLSVPVDPAAETVLDGNKPVTLESGDEKVDELRLRGNVRT